MNRIPALALNIVIYSAICRLDAGVFRAITILFSYLFGLNAFINVWYLDGDKRVRI
jgi:hypothetical protein